MEDDDRVPCYEIVGLRCPACGEQVRGADPSEDDFCIPCTGCGAVYDSLSEVIAVVRPYEPGQRARPSEGPNA